MVLGPLAKNPATGRIERMVSETYFVRVYERPAECRNCVQDTGSSICKGKCSLWPGIEERRANGDIPYVREEHTRWVFDREVA